MEVQVTTLNDYSANPNPVGNKTIDWTNRSDRKWLESHLHWAMMNHMTVNLTRPCDEPLDLSNLDL